MRRSHSHTHPRRPARTNLNAHTKHIHVKRALRLSHLLEIVGDFFLNVLYNVGHDISATVPFGPTVL